LHRFPLRYEFIFLNKFVFLRALFFDP
jgi:hypothetical protein